MKNYFSEQRTGIFESLRTYEGMIFRFEEHLDRFFESAKTVGIRIPGTRVKLKQRVQDALNNSGKKEAFLRLTLMDGKFSVIVTERSHPREIYEKGVSLRTTAVRRTPSQAGFPEAKSTVFLNQILATLEPAPPGSYEILFLNQEGYLTEARIGNFFIVKDRMLFTPPSLGLLNGVTRRFVIECARLGKISFEERPLTRHELFNAEEAFLTNTSWEILPVREVDGRVIGSAVPGPVTLKLMRLYREGVQKEIRRFQHDKNQSSLSQCLG